MNTMDSAFSGFMFRVFFFYYFFLSSGAGIETLLDGSGSGSGRNVPAAVAPAPHSCFAGNSITQTVSKTEQLGCNKRRRTSMPIYLLSPFFSSYKWENNQRNMIQSDKSQLIF